MDYSAVSSDADALHGQSPWGSSSPRADRSFASTADSPASPTPIRGHSYSDSQDSISGTQFPANTSDISNSTTLLDPNAQQQTAPQHEPPQHAQGHGQTAPLSAQEHQYLAGLNSQRQIAARYHNPKPQRSVPQYKLQAKVTALERQGRKDPVIRFDVHVIGFSSRKPRVSY